MAATPVLNSQAGLTNKTIQTSEDGQNVTGQKNYNRAPAAPFTVQAGSAVVANLDADKVDGYEATALAVLAEDETVTGAWTFSGTTTRTGAEAQTGIVTPAQIVANTNDYNPAGLATARTLRLSSDAARDLTGILAGVTGRRLLLLNVGAQDIVLKHDATSTAANRFFCPNSADFTLDANDAVELWYDITSTRWRVLAA